MFEVWLLKEAETSIFTLYTVLAVELLQKCPVLALILQDLLYKVIKVPLLSGVMGAGAQEKLSRVGVDVLLAAV